MKYMFTVKTNENVNGYWYEFDYPICFDCAFNMNTKDFNSVLDFKHKEVEKWFKDNFDHSVSIINFSSCRSLLVF